MTCTRLGDKTYHQIMLQVFALIITLELSTANAAPQQVSSATRVPASSTNIFDQYLDKSQPIATQFSVPAVDREHPNKVYAVADGQVIALRKIKMADRREGYQISLRHVYFENADRKTIFSNYELTESGYLKLGDRVKMGTLLGDQLNESIRFTLSQEYPVIVPLTPEATASFFTYHRQLFNPLQEPTLILVDTNAYRMRMVNHDKVQDLEIGIGQAKGAKQFRGDNKTPKGMYFTTNKHHGTFSGPAAAYFGGYWMKLNYPNAYDAERGLKAGWISDSQAASIKKVWLQRGETLQQTNLGGGIGLHAWAFEWSNTGSRLMSWGCVVLHPADMARYFDSFPVGTMVVLF
ncbi:L,D-transpeptidase family protein [Undibacterium cyanobacteriorum]|uniref:L,D-transpeptidase family protein n=1 Tax=Undibacterium cyanobacteriorum TaxID=3073561 RepID=A0ABY9RKE0_9BURK|nr:L,D-transpeptidase family protein [Undibacterium sp. 20NA77.5]WMW81421.1 L,D-transpeptidase family protein [Undibacterium sp. 20NA77.5]